MTYKNDADDGFHVRLAETINACKGKIILSGYRSDLYSELFPAPRWSVITEGKPRNNPLLASASESIWLNFTPQPTLF